MPNPKRQRKKAAHQARQASVARRHRQQRRRTVVVSAVLAGILILGVAALVSGGGSDTAQVDTGDSTTVPPTSVPPGQAVTGATPCPPADGSALRTTSFAQAPPMCIDPAKTYTAEIKTNKGIFTVALDPKAAPTTVNNFVVLGRYHFFDGVTFHRIIPGFVVQGGDPTGTGRGNPGYSIADELPPAGSYQEGSLAMANSGQPNSGGSQFFIITGPRGVALPPQYSLFGKVTEGMDVVKAIEGVGSPEGTPKEPAIMESVTIKES